MCQKDLNGYPMLQVRTFQVKNSIGNKLQVMYYSLPTDKHLAARAQTSADWKRSWETRDREGYKSGVGGQKPFLRGWGWFQRLGGVIIFFSEGGSPLQPQPLLTYGHKAMEFVLLRWPTKTEANWHKVVYHPIWFSYFGLGGAHPWIKSSSFLPCQHPWARGC